LSPAPWSEGRVLLASPGRTTKAQRSVRERMRGFSAADHGNDRAPARCPRPPASDTSQVGYHDLICKPNGTEDGFYCADEATPAKIVPIPWHVVGPRPQDQPITG